MYKDLAQISKAKDIYRTLDLMAILSPKAAGHKSNQHLSAKNSHKTDEQMDSSDAGVTKKSTGRKPERMDSDVG
jgi:hypothetical protein